MGALGVVDDIEPVDLFLESGDRAGEGQLVEEPAQGLMEAFVLALRGRFVGPSGDRLLAQRRGVDYELPLPAAAGGFSAIPLDQTDR